jgi:uncharacterized protein
MQNGKPAGVKCVHLTENNLCSIFNNPSRPNVCSSFPAMKDICGDSREEAFRLIRTLEIETT